MAQKGRKPQKNNAQESTGGNVLFTLGMVSVVALLIVGFVMTQEGVEDFTNKAKNMAKIPLSSPSPSPVPTVMANEPTKNELMAEYQRKLREQEKTFEKRLNDTKRMYQSQINDLKMQIKILKDENQRIRGENN